MLCGKERCPVLVRFSFQARVNKLIDSLILEGSSPPSVFVGRIGYPKVAVGPLVPPVVGDTSFIDTPELWGNVTIDDIVGFRSQLVRGKHIVNVYDVDSSDRIVSLTRELALSKESVQSEVYFEKKPSGRIIFYDEAQPHGPSAPIKKLEISNPKYDHRIEKAFYDTDLRARDAVVELYKKGALVSSIQKAFSVGAFGEKKFRRFVPTRWSITAVDSMLGEELLKQTKTSPLINEYRVYRFKRFDNRWVVLMMPTSWRYELIEAWYPKTTWNPYGGTIAIYNSYEFYNGRKTYAEIGGCYYAARLAVNETLTRERRQAGVVVFREAHPGYILPVGVWNVRETVREALKQPYVKFDNLKSALSVVKETMDIPLERWIKNSAVLKDALHQRRLEDFLHESGRETL
ncbi:MAG TPA: hypothetical protein ENI42_01945 [Thermoplasmatales archaeon]|nr:hypothetical protein [Thermoplasmatales archaeon]